MAKSNNLIEVTDVRVYPLKKKGKGPLRAFASVTLNECFAVTGIRVMEGKKGVFVGMPSREGSDGEYHDVAFPVTREFRETLHEAVLGAFADEERGKGKRKAKK